MPIPGFSLADRQRYAAALGILISMLSSGIGIYRSVRLVAKDIRRNFDTFDVTLKVIFGSDQPVLFQYLTLAWAFVLNLPVWAADISGFALFTIGVYCFQQVVIHYLLVATRRLLFTPGLIFFVLYLIQFLVANYQLVASPPCDTLLLIEICFMWIIGTILAEIR